MRKILPLLPTQISFWHLIYQITTGVGWMIALAAIPFVFFATLTGISWFKGLRKIYFKGQAKRERLLREGDPVPIYLMPIPHPFRRKG